MKSKRLTRISIMIVLSVVVNIIERYLPNLSFVPGAKWGFSNVVIIIGTLFLNFKELFIIGFLRSVFTSFAIGTFLSIQFYLSLAGSISSVCIMYILSKKNVFSFLGVSVAGSTTSNVSQLFIYSLFTSFAVLNYLPVLTIFSVLTGSVTGIISLLIKKKVQAYALNYSNIKNE